MGVSDKDKGSLDETLKNLNLSNEVRKGSRASQHGLDRGPGAGAQFGKLFMQGDCCIYRRRLISSPRPSKTLSSLSCSRSMHAKCPTPRWAPSLFC